MTGGIRVPVCAIGEAVKLAVTGLVIADRNIRRISKVFGAAVIDYAITNVLLECTQTESRNDDLIALLKRKFANRMEIVRGGSVAVEAVSMSER